MRAPGRMIPSLVLAAALHASAAAGQSAPRGDRARAVERYERGRAHYAAGRYRLAVAELEAAYALDPSGTNLLINIGTVYERMGRIDEAIRAFERHLALTQDPDERERTRHILARLRGARVELAGIARRPGLADGAFWITTGAAIASGGLGVTMFATERAGSAPAAPLAFVVTGASLGLLAAVLYFAREAPPQRSLFVSAAPSGAALLGVAGTF